MKPPKKTKVRKVKAWAVVHKNKLCENLECTGNGPDDYWTYFTHKTKAEAELALKYSGGRPYWDIIPCTITYSLKK